MPPENNTQPTLKNPEPAQTPPPLSPLKQIRTFQGDVADALGRQKESLFSIQQTERLKKGMGGTVPDTIPDDSGKRKEFFFLIFGSIFLISLALAGVWFGYIEYTKKIAPPVVSVPESRLIAVQEEVALNAASSSRDNLISGISSQVAPAGELLNIVLRNGAADIDPLLTTTQLLNALKSVAPGSLVRAFDPLFMIGANGDSRFIIIRLSSFENAFPGMLAWEANMAADIGPLFKTYPLLKNNGPESVFIDVISRNKDVRVLYAPTQVGATSTEPALLYSFFDRQFLIITDSLETLRIVVERLTQEMLSR